MKKRVISFSLAFFIFISSLVASLAVPVPVYADQVNMFSRIFSQLDDSIWFEINVFADLVSNFFAGTYSEDELKALLNAKYEQYADPVTGLVDYSRIPDSDKPAVPDFGNQSITINQNFMDEIVQEGQEYCHRMDGYYFIEQNTTIFDVFSKYGKVNSGASATVPFDTRGNCFVTYTKTKPTFFYFRSSVAYLSGSVVTFPSGSNSVERHTPEFGTYHPEPDYIYINSWTSSLSHCAFMASNFGSESSSTAYVQKYFGNPLMLFYTKAAYERYVNQGRQYYAPVFSIPSSGLVLDSNILSGNNLSDLFHLELGDTSGLTEEEMQKLLDDAVQKLIDGLSGSSGGGSSGGGDSGGSSGGSSKDYSSYFGTIIANLQLIVTRLSSLDAIEDFLSDISLRVVNIDLDLTKFFLRLFEFDLSEHFAELLDTLTEFMNVVKNLDFDVDVTTQQSFLDRLLDLLFDKINDIGNLLDLIIGNVISSFLTDFLGSVVGDFTQLQDDLTDYVTGISSDLIQKFPMCIPWDLAALVSVFSAEPEAPKFDIPVKLSAINIDEALVIDFSKYEDLAVVGRKFFMILFLLILTLQSRKMFGVLFSLKGGDG